MVEREKAGELVPQNQTAPQIERAEEEIPTVQVTRNTNTMEKTLPMSPYIENIVKALRPPWELKLTEEELRQLRQPLTDEEKKSIQIKPTGIVFLSWEFYAGRMDDIFGVNQWSLLTVNGPKVYQQKVIVECVLAVKGCWVDTAIGECEYIPGNSQMSWTDAVEGARSNALSRLVGKRLGIGRELWNPDFCRAWVRENAVQVWRGGKLIWVKKTDVLPTDRPYQTETPQKPAERPAEQKPAISQKPAEQKPSVAQKTSVEPWDWTPKDRQGKMKTIRAIFSRLGWKENDIKSHIYATYGKEHSSELSDEQVDELLNFARGLALVVREKTEEVQK